ncbi:uncharacterized protein LOC124492665 isoform X2 [Dermatophagoides farinae]|uniref:uncharacterized protein LOC124492665 isoform X2 n=1 Tax=Dermatophagoides farinae TaxID=6954 RepID=UPI003F61C044
MIDDNQSMTTIDQRKLSKSDYNEHNHFHHHNQQPQQQKNSSELSFFNSKMIVSSSSSSPKTTATSLTNNNDNNQTKMKKDKQEKWQKSMKKNEKDKDDDDDGKIKSFKSIEHQVYEYKQSNVDNDDKTTKNKNDSSNESLDNNCKNKSRDHNNKNNNNKKSVNSVRRRRFRSGLDMIRNSRKKSYKTKMIRKEQQCNNNGKKEISMDNSINGRRFVVNKSLGETLLHRSARNNRLNVVRLCLESDACDVNARDNAGYTPLHECSSRGNLEIARLLLQHSADVNASATGGIRPLHDAIENDHIEIVRLLLSYGADPHISTYSGTTPLQLSRSKMMSKFLNGFYSDISSDRSMIDETNVWKFNSHDHHCLDSGFDVFADIPSDDSNDDDGHDDDDMEYEFEASCRPLLNLYTFLHKPNQCPFYLVCDVIKSLKMTREIFINKYHHMVNISRINRSDFETNGLIVQLEKRRSNCKILNDKNKQTMNEQQQQQHEIEIVYQSEQINRILDIELTVI